MSFDQLPAETIFNILEYCNGKTIIALRYTNRYLFNLISVKEILKKIHQIGQENKRLRKENNLLQRQLDEKRFERYLRLLEVGKDFCPESEYSYTTTDDEY